MSDCLSKNKKNLILVLWSWPEEVPQRSWSSALTIKTYDPWSSGPDIKEWLLLKKKCILVLWSCPEWVPDNQSIWDPPRIRKSEYLSSGSVMKEFCLSKRLYTVVWLLCWPLVLWSFLKNVVRRNFANLDPLRMGVTVYLPRIWGVPPAGGPLL